jgi:hypothetical protein
MLFAGWPPGRKHLRLKGVLVGWQADPNFNNEQHLQGSDHLLAISMGYA